MTSRTSTCGEGRLSLECGFSSSDNRRGIVPMAFSRREYFDEVVAGLKSLDPMFVCSAFERIWRRSLKGSTPGAGPAAPALWPGAYERRAGVSRHTKMRTSGSR